MHEKKRGVRNEIWCGLAMLLAMTGCGGTPTPYQPLGFMGGYQNNWLQNNEHQVSFNGNALVPMSTAKDMAMLRAAEVTLLTGCGFFVIEQTDVDVKETMSDVGGTIQTIRKPLVTMRIACFAEYPKDAGRDVYDATQVARNLRAKHDIPEPIAGEPLSESKAEQ